MMSEVGDLSMFSQAFSIYDLRVENESYPHVLRVTEKWLCARKNLKVFPGNITMSRPECRFWLFFTLTEPEVYALE